ncbi:MAG: 8-amino-7-oxononanoate synthase [Myxococcota bacterium]|nr:8-amino-7-oxononanoate synthase [Myxococcota bacterium]
MNSVTQRFAQELDERLTQRRDDALLRTLVPASGIDFTSNDYLDLRTHPALAEAIYESTRSHGTGSGASRLLRGNHPVHTEVERALATFSSRESALLFSTGFSLNTGLLPALTSRDDVIFSDSLNHASIIDGIRLSAAQCAIFEHQNFNHLATKIRDTPCRGKRFIVTESLFSMDGDLTDLEALCALAEEYEALLIVDEAHATGLYGHLGAGRVQQLGLEERVLASIHTGGKALGVGGAWVASSAPVISYLVNFCRSFIYSTAPIPALAGALNRAIQLRGDLQTQADHLQELAAHFRQQLNAHEVDTLTSASQIIPVMLGSNERALFVAEALRGDGFDIRAIRPPTVAPGSARLRITLRASMSYTLIDQLADRIIHHIKGYSR